MSVKFHADGRAYTTNLTAALHNCCANAPQKSISNCFGADMPTRSQTDGTDDLHIRRGFLFFKERLLSSNSSIDVSDLSQ
jgi:hypothetical protein